MNKNSCHVLPDEERRIPTTQGNMNITHLFDIQLHGTQGEGLNDRAILACHYNLTYIWVHFVNSINKLLFLLYSSSWVAPSVIIRRSPFLCGKFYSFIQ